MPIGIMLVSGAVLVGGLVGSRLGRFIPQRVSDGVISMFGIISILIGISLIARMEQLPAVVLALLFGVIIGEGFRLEARVTSACNRLATRKRPGAPSRDPEDEASALARVDRIDALLSAAVMLCTGIGGLMGAMMEGFSGDLSLLTSKAFMDLFCSFSFAATIGAIVMVVAIPQFILLFALFLLSGFILPFLTPGMIGDFYAAGGVVSIITGLRVAGIRQFAVINTLPALVLVMPLSSLWATVVAPLL